MSKSVAAAGVHYHVWNCDHLENALYDIADSDANADERLMLMQGCLPPDYAAALMDRHSQEVQTPSKFHLFDGKPIYPHVSSSSNRQKFQSKSS